MAKNSKQESGLSEYVFGKLPPQAIELERAVLGALMIDREAPALVADILSPESFYLESHQVIYRAIMDLFNRSNPVDMLTVVEHLKKSGAIEKTDGAFQVMELTHIVASAANLEYHARIVSQKAISRQIIQQATEAIRIAYEDSEDTFEMLDRVQTRMFAISAVRSDTQVMSIKEATLAALNEMEATEKTGIETGLKSLDKAIGGFMPGELTIIAARPGMGKTALVLLTALVNAIAGKPMWFVSLEMTGPQLAKRVLSKNTGISTERLRSGDLKDSDFEKLTIAAEAQMDLPIYFAGFRTPNQLWTAVRRAVAKGEISGLVVDYLQLMDGNDTKGNREQEIATISRTLKKISTEFNIPVIALSQLNRAVENRTNKMPNLADLRESGAIEQDADIVIFIYRPEEYGIEQLNIVEHGQQKMVDAKDGALIYTAKFRHGQQRSAWVRFKDGHFSDWEDERNFPKSEVRYNPSEEPNSKDEYLPF